MQRTVAITFGFGDVYDITLGFGDVYDITLGFGDVQDFARRFAAPNYCRFGVKRHTDFKKLTVTTSAKCVYDQMAFGKVSPAQIDDKNRVNTFPESTATKFKMTLIN